VGDKDGTKAYLDFVADQGCSLSNFPAGKTLRLKQQLGLRGYRLLKPVVDFARGSGVSRPNVPRDPKLFGEWPTVSNSPTARSARVDGTRPARIDHEGQSRGRKHDTLGCSG
jgi:hypothetical protein